jgi:hypothetical protein
LILRIEIDALGGRDMEQIALKKSGSLRRNTFWLERSILDQQPCRSDISFRVSNSAPVPQESKIGAIARVPVRTKWFKVAQISSRALGVTIVPHVMRSTLARD